MDAATITGHYRNGYDNVGATNSPGAYSIVDSATFNRVISGNWLDHFVTQTPGLYSGAGTGNTAGLSIRGRNSLITGSAPFGVLDNFGWLISPAYINPYDINFVTLLKDAAAAGVWGYVSSDGVIVATTYKGEYRRPFHIRFVANTTFTAAPDLGYIPRLGSKGYISMEQTLFNRKFYDGLLSKATYAVTPAVSILDKWRSHLWTDDQANSALQQLATTNPADELKRHFYRDRISRHTAEQQRLPAGGLSVCKIDRRRGKAGRRRLQIQSGVPRYGRWRKPAQLAIPAIGRVGAGE
jgi:hypothetical protein